MNRVDIINTFPAMYKNILPDIFCSEIPKEYLATCDNCAMLSGADESDIDGISIYYNPKTKCCTYQPDIPNYLIGGMLEDNSSKLETGRARIKDQLIGGVGVHPLGLLASMVKRHLYRHGKEQSFGRSTTLRCRFYEEKPGYCTIWPYRMSVCTTWYCKYAVGIDGKKFWQAVCSYLGYVERLLSRYAVAQLGLDATAMLDKADEQKDDKSGQKLTWQDLDEVRLPDKAYKKLWGSWANREETFYVECHRIINGLQKKDFERLGGFILELYGQDVQNALEKVKSVALPKYLFRNPNLKVKKRENAYFITSMGYPFEITGDVYKVIDEFDGKTATSEVKKSIARNHQTELDDELILDLYHNRILIEPEQ
jgi:hypothetical protein